ncbi:unnamed protein product [Clavelina lepadiformis]|uniref:Uncharacterized protein n=1 Tax=Clavelina lepadiformis TaxID=159417 RepID=A0ABP0GU28_CLALP
MPLPSPSDITPLIMLGLAVGLIVFVVLCTMSLNKFFEVKDRHRRREDKQLIGTAAPSDSEKLAEVFTLSWRQLEILQNEDPVFSSERSSVASNEEKQSLLENFKNVKNYNSLSDDDKNASPQKSDSSK